MSSKEWYMNIGSPRYVVAPMVDASELPWRLLCKRHGAELCYTPMLHSSVFTRDPKYRRDNLATCKEDRPLIVQFCGNVPETMATAAKLAAPMCDAIDINLGCPQAIAKRGRYGSFLQDEWELLKQMIQGMKAAVDIPITCKVRVFTSIEKTVEYALMLQEAGCSLLTVHGRTREQKGPMTGIASWEHIKAIRQAVSIPMFANGNIQCLQDVHRCLDFAGVDGVMSAEGNLTNPAIFEGINPVIWDVTEEYLDLVAKYPCPTAYIRGHIFKMFHKIFTYQENNEDRELLATAQNLDDFRKVCSNIKAKYLKFHLGEEVFSHLGDTYDLVLPPWICQPYVRMSPEQHIKKLETLSYVHSIDDRIKRVHEDPDGNIITRKKMKKLRRILRKPPKSDHESAPQRHCEICVVDTCPNPRGGKCLYQLCKQCCKNKCFFQDLDCAGHRILVHTRREMAKKFSTMAKEEQSVQVKL